jgi:hypothetical protein
MSATASAEVAPSVALPTDQGAGAQGHPDARRLQCQWRDFWRPGHGPGSIWPARLIPARYTGGRMATVAVNAFIFQQPVRAGGIPSFFSRLTRIGRTSVTVKVEV